MEFDLLLFVAVHCSLFGAGLARRFNRDAFLWGLVCLFTGTIGLGILWILGRHSEDRFDAMFPTPLKRWQTLLSVDDDIAAASRHVLSEAGWHAERELAERYLYLDDKQYLDRLITKVVSKYPRKKNGAAPASYMAGSWKGADLRKPERAGTDPLVEEKPFRLEPDMWRQSKDGKSFVVTKGPHAGMEFGSLKAMEDYLTL